MSNTLQNEPLSEKLLVVKAHLLKEFYSAADHYKLNSHDRRVLVDTVANFGSFFAARPQQSLMDANPGQPMLIPPEVFALRLDRNESPVAFIRRVYADYYFSGLNRKHLDWLDADLHDALVKYERRNPGKTLREMPRCIAA